MKNIIDLIGRLFLSFLFLYEAYDSIFYWKATKEMMTSYGILWRQDLLLLGSITLLIFGGLSVLLGYRVKFGVFLLLAYWIPVTFIVHSFWLYPIADQRIQAILLMKNIAIIGGLLMLYINGSGGFSIRRLFATTKVRGS